MSLINKILPLVLLLLTCSLRAETQVASPDRAASAPGKAYVYKQSAGKPRELEIYFPVDHNPARAKVPGVILFHGGGWGSGDLSVLRDQCRYLASRGLVAITANYRMLTKEDKPAKGETKKGVCITDAKSAIRWFKQHAGELGVDPSRIITGGSSAGGHIAMLATLNPGLNDPADPHGVDTSVVAYLLFNPAFEAHDAVRDPEVDIMRFLRPDISPAIVLFGTKDEWKLGCDGVYNKLTALGNTTTEYLLAEGVGHTFYNRVPRWKTLSLIACDRFLSKLGLLAGEPTLKAPLTGEQFKQAGAITIHPTS
jgi:acetyl esterase